MYSTIEKKKLVLMNLAWSLFLVIIVLAVALLVKPNIICEADLFFSYYFPNLYGIYDGLAVYVIVSAIAVVIANIFVFIVRKIFGPAELGIETNSAEMPSNPKVSASGNAEVKQVLKTMDDLLAKLPEQEIENFMKSKEAKKYRKVLEKFGIE